MPLFSEKSATIFQLVQGCAETSDPYGHLYDRVTNFKGQTQWPESVVTQVCDAAKQILNVLLECKSDVAMNPADMLAQH